MEPEVELEILDVLETNATEPLQRLCRLLEFSELEINSGLSQLVTKGYVSKSGNNFKITLSGKIHISEVRGGDGTAN